MDGWVVLDQLKHDPRTRHIPVHIISARRRASAAALEHGALAFAAEAGRARATRATRSTRIQRLPRAAGQAACWWSRTTTSSARAIVELIGNGDVVTTAVDSGEAALAALEQQPFDCMVLDLKLPGMSRLRADRSAIKERPDAAAAADHRLHRQGADARGGDRAAARWPRPSSSRTCSRRSACSTRPRCSCTASRRTCRRRSAQMLRTARRDRSGAGGQEGAGRRRRRAQHLRDHRPSSSSTR